MPTVDVSQLRRALHWLARRRAAGVALQWIFTHMSFAVPAKRLRETDTLLAFHHPLPSHAVHVLLVPKRPYKTILDVSPDDTALIADLLATVRDLVDQLNLADGGYRLIVNGGAYQETELLHFHLVGDRPCDE